MKKSKKKILNLKKDTNISTMSERTFNLIMGGSILYGLILNLLMCFFCNNMLSQINPLILGIGALVGIILAMIIIASTNNTFLIILGYNLLCIIMGCLVSCSVMYFKTDVIVKAIIATIFLVLIMIFVSSLFPNFFLKLGRTLFFSLLAMIVVNIFFLLVTHTTPGIIFYISVIIFSLFIGYDWQKAQKASKTFKNAILCASELYIDIINIFTDLLSIIDDFS